MPTLSRTETEIVEQLVQKLLAIHKKNDQLMFSADPFGVQMRQIPHPPQAVVAEGREIGTLLETKGIQCPRLREFVHDPSPFEIENVMLELREIERVHGED